MATATHAAGRRGICLRIDVGKNLKEVRNGGFNAIKPKERLENVDDVIHY